MTADLKAERQNIISIVFGNLKCLISDYPATCPGFDHSYISTLPSLDDIGDSTQSFHVYVPSLPLTFASFGICKNVSILEEVQEGTEARMWVVHRSCLLVHRH